MTAAARIALFTAALAGVFVIALWVGNAAGPDPDRAVPPHQTTAEHPHPGGAP